jgi:hypothetical protein
VQNVYIFGTGEDFDDLIDYFRSHKDKYFNLVKYIDLEKMYVVDIQKEFKNIISDDQNLIVIDTEHSKIKMLKEYLY